MCQTGELQLGDFVAPMGSDRAEEEVQRVQEVRKAGRKQVEELVEV